MKNIRGTFFHKERDSANVLMTYRRSFAVLHKHILLLRYAVCFRFISAAEKKRAI